MGQPLYCSAADAGPGERGYGEGSNRYAWLSSIALLPWLPGFPPQAFPTTISLTSLDLSLRSQQHPLLWVAPQSLNPSSQPLSLPGDQHSWICMGYVWGYVRGMYGCSKDCLILIPFRLPQISCFPPSLKCFSSDSDNCLDVEIGPLLQFPDPRRASQVLLTLLFFPLVPSSYWAWCGFIYSFPLVRYSCLLSAHILHALLCLKVYSWCIRGERCTPQPPTPPPSCSPQLKF